MDTTDKSSKISCLTLWTALGGVNRWEMSAEDATSPLLCSILCMSCSPPANPRGQLWEPWWESLQPVPLERNKPPEINSRFLRFVSHQLQIQWSFPKQKQFWFGLYTVNSFACPDKIRSRGAKEAWSPNTTKFMFYCWCLLFKMKRSGKFSFLLRNSKNMSLCQLQSAIQSTLHMVEILTGMYTF